MTGRARGAGAGWTVDAVTGPNSPSRLTLPLQPAWPPPAKLRPNPVCAPLLQLKEKRPLRIPSTATPKNITPPYDHRNSGITGSLTGLLMEKHFKKSFCAIAT